MSPPTDTRDRSAETRGLALGLLGVVIFAMTVPMTRLAVGPALEPQLPPLFVTAGRAAIAGLLSCVYLFATHAPLPQRRQLAGLLLSALGTVVGFPLFLALALPVGESAEANWAVLMMPAKAAQPPAIMKL